MFHRVIASIFFVSVAASAVAAMTLVRMGVEYIFLLACSALYCLAAAWAWLFNPKSATRHFRALAEWARVSPAEKQSQARSLFTLGLILYWCGLFAFWIVVLALGSQKIGLAVAVAAIIGLVGLIAHAIWIAKMRA